MKDRAQQRSGHFAEEGAIAIVGTELEGPFLGVPVTFFDLTFCRSRRIWLLHVDKDREINRRYLIARII